MPALPVAVILLGGFLGITPGLAKPAEAITARASVRQFWTEEFRRLESAPRPKKKDDDGHFARLTAQALDAQALILPEDTSPAGIVLRRTSAMLAHFRALFPEKDWSRLETELAEVRGRMAAAKTGEEQQALYLETCALRRQIALGNPLLNFESILFVAAGIHQKAHEALIITHYYGIMGKGGGALYRLETPFTEAPRVTDVLSKAKPGSGRYQGRSLAGGAFLAPELSFDGRQILFCSVAPETAAGDGKGKPGRNKAWNPQTGWGPDSAYHIFRVNADSTGLTQLTDGGWNDLDPCFDPSGRIVFISERRGGQSRCGITTPAPTYTLHSMREDGSDIVTLSYYDTNEWQPSFDENGLIVYTRWDYVDRAFPCGHHLWTCFPDGRNPRAPHGNWPFPWGHKPDWGGPLADTKKHGLGQRPYAELGLGAVPGSPRFVATAAPHHGWGLGSLVLIEPSVPDDHQMSQVKRLTPDAKFPESEGDAAVGPYGTAWPLSEDFHLCNDHSDLVLVDRFGNRELILAKSEVPGNLDDDFRLLDPSRCRPGPGRRSFRGQPRKPRAALRPHRITMCNSPPRNAAASPSGWTAIPPSSASIPATAARRNRRVSWSGPCLMWTRRIQPAWNLRSR